MIRKKSRYSRFCLIYLIVASFNLTSIYGFGLAVPGFTPDTTDDSEPEEQYYDGNRPAEPSLGKPVKNVLNYYSVS